MGGQAGSGIIGGLQRDQRASGSTGVIERMGGGGQTASARGSGGQAGSTGGNGGRQDPGD